MGGETIVPHALRLFVFSFVLALLTVSVLSADTVTVTLSSANIRSGPGTSYDPIGTVSRGERFPVLSTQQGWYQIRLDDGRAGWIYESIVTVQSSGRAVGIVSKESMGQRRVALVIGNGLYQATTPLRNPPNDAEDVAKTLGDLGFEVTTVVNGTRREMIHAISQFGLNLRQGGIGLFYYAGHGVQVNGENYLVPVDANLQQEHEVQFDAVHLSRVLASMESANNPANIVILDACRNNPFARQWRRYRSTEVPEGLAIVQTARGTLIAYATSPGDVAADGEGRNGTYTKHLLRHMSQPGLTIERMLKLVRQGVTEETRDQQTPWESSSLVGSSSSSW